MVYVKERAAVILRELKSCAVTRSTPLTGFIKKDGFFLRPQDADAVQGLPFSPDTEAAVSQDGHFWLTASLSVPEGFDRDALWLSVSNSHGGWALENPQLLIFCNGEIIQAGDGNHREALILPHACAGDSFRLDLQIYAGCSCLPAGALCFCLQQRDPSVEKLCYDLSIPLDILSWITPDTSDSIRLEQILQKAVNLIDLRETDSDTFSDSVREADSFLEQELYNTPDDRAPIASCVGHTHIDVAWWWTVQQTREKAVRSFSTVLKLMDEYPEYRFMSSQPQLYAFVKERYPEVFEKIRSRVLEGRWEVEGGMWLEADCNLISGESMVRQLLFGKEFFRKEFGKDTRVCWLPDVFGYSAAMPQILKKSGIDYFMTTKISWNQFNKLPMDTFWWKGIDGTEIFTHLITTQDASQHKERFSTTYNGNLNAVSVIRAWERYQQKDCARDVLLSCGFGDGGGGTTREMLENARRLSFGIAGTPKVRWDFSRTYFDRLLEQCGSNPSLPRWVGELYLEYHRGTYTSMARNKKSNRKSELMLQQIELFSAWASRFGFPYPAKELHRAWEKVLLNQFHDILPGSSIHEVYEVTAQEYRQLDELFCHILSEALSALASHSGASKGELLVFSPLCFAHNATVETAPAVTALRGSDGTLYIGQRENDHTLFSLPLCDAAGINRFIPETLSCEAPSPFTIRGQELETPFYRIQFANDGTIASLYDKEAQRELTSPGGSLNRLTAYEDKPMDFDNWDIDIYYTEKSWPLDSCTMEWISAGPVRATLRVIKPFLHSNIRQDIHFYADRKEIVFDTEIDWKQHQLLLKADFDLDIHADAAISSSVISQGLHTKIPPGIWHALRYAPTNGRIFRRKATAQPS